jgi:hypothetical protein
LLKRLNKKMAVRELAKLLPQTAKQIERLASLASGRGPHFAISSQNGNPRSSLVTQGAGGQNRATAFANPLVFFVNDKQLQIVENALSLARSRCTGKNEKTKAAKNAAALTYIARHFLIQESSRRQNNNPAGSSGPELDGFQPPATRRQQNDG